MTFELSRHNKFCIRLGELSTDDRNSSFLWGQFGKSENNADDRPLLVVTFARHIGSVIMQGLFANNFVKFSFHSAFLKTNCEQNCTCTADICNASLRCLEMHFTSLAWKNYVSDSHLRICIDEKINKIAPSLLLNDARLTKIKYRYQSIGIQKLSHCQS